MQIFSTVSQVVTVLAAVLALVYAHATIRQGRAGQREAHLWRQEDVAQLRAERELADAAHAATLAQLQRLHDQMVATQAEQAAGHAASQEAEQRVQRLAALGRLAAALVALADVAFDESQAPPAPARLALPPTRLHLMAAQLRAAAPVYAALKGGPVDGIGPLLTELEPYLGGEPPQKFQGLAKIALDGVARAAARESPAATAGA